MEIPYIVTPRKDTGLFNSKIAIWLFLASEVMLFGGFFSAYIFLRLGADFPWPERTLPVLPGLINTFVLIASSVTVVFAWASLKMRQWGKFQAYMAFTVVCSLVFMVLKGIEYNVKFHHQAVRLKDYTVVEGHLGYEVKDGVHLEHGHDPTEEQLERDYKGNKIEENVINYEVSQISFNTVRFHKPWVEGIIARAAEKGATLKLASTLELATAPGKAVTFEEGTPLDLKLLESIKEAHLAARAHNSDQRTESLRQQWAKAKEANPGKNDRQLAPDVSVDVAALELMPEQAAIPFNVEPPTVFRFKPRDIKEDAGSLRDGTALTGKMIESPMVFHYVDAIDFRHTAMKAEEKGIDPEIAIENSWLLKENGELREASKRSSSTATASTRKPASRTACRPRRSATASVGRTSCRRPPVLGAEMRRFSSKRSSSARTTRAGRNSTPSRIFRFPASRSSLPRNSRPRGIPTTPSTSR